MSSQSVNHTENNASRIKRNRFFGIIIVVMVVAPMAIAYIMFQTGWGVSGSTTNKGTLLNPPLPIQELNLQENNPFFEALFSDKQTSKKWRLLVPVDADCSEVCQKNLYTTRQVHIRLAEKAYRLERIILSLDDLPQSLTEKLNQEHPNTLLPATTHAEFSRWISPANILGNTKHYYYLVDQEGFVMMRYDVSHTGHDLLDDIKKLLKFTYDK
jgi:cytochrome oxidase Cu insertion factor (SCO1/SenC/PrrC family)